MNTNKPTNIDDYIKAFPKSTRTILQQVRIAIKKAAPKAEEKISYSMPTFYLNGNLVHFAAYKNHIGFYPAPSALKVFQKEISRFKNSKGAVQFPIDAPMPLRLIGDMVKFRVKENMAKVKAPKKA